MPGEMKVSQFRQVGIGKVAENLDISMGDDGKFNSIALIFPNEWNPFKDGEIKSNPTDVEFTTIDSEGVESKGGITVDQAIPMSWLPKSSNRLTPPNLRRGERVEIWQMADHNEYYWATMGVDDHLRKLETVIWGISATQDENQTVLDPANMYWLEISSHSKRIALSTSKAGGEPFLYEMFFDTKDGKFSVNDDVGNYFEMVSKQKLLHLQNSDGTFIELNKKDIRMNAPKDLYVNVGKNADIKCGNQFKVTVGGTVFTLDPAAITMKSSAIDMMN